MEPRRIEDSFSHGKIWKSLHDVIWHKHHCSHTHTHPVQFEILQAKHKTISLRKRINVLVTNEKNTQFHQKQSEKEIVHLKMNPLEEKICIFIAVPYRMVVLKQ